MIISFFTDTEYVAWVDYSWHPQCIHQEDIEIDLTTQIPVLKKSKWKYSIKITDIVQEETYDQKKERIKNDLCTSEKYQEVDTDGVFFQTSEIWPMIIARFFKSDPNAEMAFLQKWNFLTSIQEKTPEQEAEIEMIKAGYVAKEEFKDFLLSLINK